ncbi:MAG: beta-lactamase family protein [Ruminococcus flavefaciens]|nr:beta-lactamase family protein [Ruminococcus flavefaciens]
MSDIFSDFIQEIEKNNLNLHGIEIFKDSDIIFRHMWNDDIRYPIYSATKSFTSTAVGIATDEGKISVDAPLSEYLEKKYLQNMNDDLRRDFCRLTVKRFLTMSVNGYPFRPSGKDWLETVLQTNAEYLKTSFSYTNVSAYLVGVACENATGESMKEYLKTRLFEPLGIENPTSQCDPQGRFYGATGMYLTIHELSLLGQLYLKKGILCNKRILSEKWIDEATKLHINNIDGGYGYFFWVNGDHFSIIGKWGQKCLIYPQKNLMITYLGDMPESSEKMQSIAEKFAGNY